MHITSFVKVGYAGYSENDQAQIKKSTLNYTYWVHEIEQVGLVARQIVAVAKKNKVQNVTIKLYER
jgi:hypothetical protein